MPELKIPGIDFDMLEKQRLAVWELYDKICKVGQCEHPPEEIGTAEQRNALEGVLNMLDFWSDKIDRE